jgi:phosphoglycolate phosphatase
LGRHRGEEFKAEADKAVLSFELSGAESCFPLEGAKQLLEWLHLKGVCTGIITRNSSSVVEKLLQGAGFCYDALLAREAVPRVKPHPDHIFAMLEKLGASPKETLMVGDHIWDMAGGKSAGLQCVGVITGTSTKEELSSAGANIVLDDITQLSGWLMENFSLSER